MKNLFIDTNIWLSLYHFTKDDLNQFNKLKELIDVDIKLFVPKQVKDELLRNREVKIKDAMEKFHMNSISYPVFCKEYEEYNDFSKDYTDLEKRLAKWKKKIEEQIKKDDLPADKVIMELFEKAGLIDCEEYVDAAYNRYRRGNPPGKDNKYGDAINWECLLHCVPDGEDLYFLSSDKDYRSVLYKTDFNPFLKEEWRVKKKSKVIFYCNLVPFLNEHIKEINLKNEKEKLIESLSYSCSPESTREIIARLKEHSGWTEAQIDRIFEIAEKNQHLIKFENDNDVESFYFRLIDELYELLLKEMNS